MQRESLCLAYGIIYLERFRFSLIPITEDKKPAIRWKEFQTRRPQVKELIEWVYQFPNLGIVTGRISDIVVVDCESRDDAVWFWENRGKANGIVKTRRGFHFYFRHPEGEEPVQNATKLEGHYDVRGEGGYVVAPPSRHSEGEYRWVVPMSSVVELTRFKREWRPPVRTGWIGKPRELKDVLRLMDRIQAISGCRGHDTTFRVACLLRDSGISEAEALLYLQQWNRTHCHPPWSDRELLHKIEDAYRVGRLEEEGSDDEW